MAALIKHVLSRSYVTKPHLNYFFKGRKKIVWQNPIKPVKKIDSVITGIAARGFLRPLKDYSPPEDVTTRCDEIVSKTLGPAANDATPIGDPQCRFSILNDCYKEFKHSVPNSLLHTIVTIGDLKNFYATPITTTTPLDKLKTMDLPQNLHVQYEPVRFHPETDTMFDGKTAFPKSSTLVTGLRSRKKYKSYIIPDNYVRE